MQEGSDLVRKAKLNLVDLAGSERVSRTNSDGVLLREAKYINLSLHYLEQVIIALQVCSLCCRGGRHSVWQATQPARQLHSSLKCTARRPKAHTTTSNVVCLVPSTGAQHWSWHADTSARAISQQHTDGDAEGQPGRQLQHRNAGDHQLRGFPAGGVDRHLPLCTTCGHDHQRGAQSRKLSVSLPVVVVFLACREVFLPDTTCHGILTAVL